MLKHKIQFIFIFIIILSFACSEQKPGPVQKPKVIKDSTSEMSVLSVGDIMCHSTQYGYAWVEQDSFNFKPVFKYVKDFFHQKDLVTGNLETVFAGKGNGYSGFPFFNSPDQLLDALKDTGFKILFTSNNHALDQGKTGVIRTIKEIRKRGMINIGTYLSQKDRDSIRIINMKGIKLAVLAYSYGTNGVRIPSKSKYLISIIDTSSIRSDLIKTKKLNPDVIIVYFHFGKEYSRKPSKFQRKIVKFAILNGADIILASHTHTLQPVETFPLKNSKLDSGFVAYSLGNFVSNQRWRYSDGGAMLNFTIEKNFTKNKIKIKNLRFLPFWVYKGKINGKKEYAVLPLTNSSISNTYPFLNSKDLLTMEQCIFDVLDIMKKSTPKLKLLKFKYNQLVSKN